MVKKKEKDEEFDVFSDYLERIETGKKEEPEIHRVKLGEILLDIKKFAERDKKLAVVLAVELALTVVIILMLVGAIPWI